MTPEQRIAEAIGEDWCFRYRFRRRLPDIGPHNILHVVEWAAKTKLFSQNLFKFLTLSEAYERLMCGITTAAEATTEIIKIIAKAIEENER